MKVREILIAAVLVLAVSLPSRTVAFAADAQGGCATIAGGTITDNAGNPLSVGFDQYGYNYQAHLFVGTFDSVDRQIDGTYYGTTGDFVNDALIMKWSDAWLASVDCNHDGKLDRGLVDGQVGGTSRGWLTNEINGDYSDASGTHHYTEFTKIVWVGPGGDLWGEYTILQDVYNDPAAGSHGTDIKVGAPGFGLNDQWTTN